MSGSNAFKWSVTKAFYIAAEHMRFATNLLKINGIMSP